MPAGRPTKYKPEYVELVYKLALTGDTDQQIANILNCSVDAMYEWEKQYPEFSQSKKKGKAEHDDNLVEASLLHRARGYSHAGEKIFMTKEGEIIRAETVEHYPPDPTSMIFWLKNRQSQKWRDRHEHTGANGTPLIPVLNVGKPETK